jgi:uncharacterized protein (TIGR00369 family)
MTEAGMTLEKLQQLITRGPFNRWLDFTILNDVAADYAIAAQLGRPAPTIDIRVDYHKAAMPGDLIAKARVVRMGSQYSTAEAYVYDSEGALVASGRGTYLTVTPKS